MTARVSQLRVRDLPVELVEAADAEMRRCAEQILQFFREIGIEFNKNNPICFPPRCLLYLSAAVCIEGWESQGFTFHHQYNLPQPRELIADAYSSCFDRSLDPTALCDRVFDIWIDCIAWHGHRDFGADVAIGELCDDGELGALAEFLWANRHNTSEKQDLQLRG
jgi:hypothetical protein